MARVSLPAFVPLRPLVRPPSPTPLPPLPHLPSPLQSFPRISPIHPILQTPIPPVPQTPIPPTPQTQVLVQVQAAPRSRRRNLRSKIHPFLHQGERGRQRPHPQDTLCLLFIAHLLLQLMEKSVAQQPKPSPPPSSLLECRQTLVPATLMGRQVTTMTRRPSLTCQTRDTGMLNPLRPLVLFPPSLLSGWRTKLATPPSSPSDIPFHLTAVPSRSLPSTSPPPLATLGTETLSILQHYTCPLPSSTPGHTHPCPPPVRTLRLVYFCL